MAKDLAPFTCSHSQGFAEFLINQNCSIAISTYQAGKVIFISPKDRDHIIQLPRNFAKPMGIAIAGDKMAIATREEVVVLANSKSLATSYPNQPGTYDNMFIPRATYYTGEIDLHDLHWTPKGLLAVNTRFSCLSLINDNYSFTPVWQPAFINNLQPDDACHLNGVAMAGNEPCYVTALGTTSTPSGWREKKATGGVLIDVKTKEVILENLPMPHSPRIYQNRILVLLSATGELAEVNVRDRSYTVIKKLDGFVRGMDICGDYLFIGLSKLRTTSNTFNDLPISRQSVVCGIVVIHLPTGSLCHQLKYENSVEEIYDVRVLPGMLRPGILNHIRPEYKRALSLPGQTFWSKEVENEQS